MKLTTKHLLLALAIACLPALQGCFPVAAVGMTASALLVSDRRTVAAQAVDQELEYRIGRHLETDISKNAHVNVTSFNQTVLLTGEVPNEAERAKVEAIAKSMPYSPKVVNELQVRPASSLVSRSDDALLTSTIKSRLAGSDVVLPNHVKIISEDGVVFVMGLVTEREARSALQIAAESTGVVKVVNVTQLIRDPEEVRREEEAKRPLPPDPETTTPLWRPQRF
ncbi:MAG TPA: BON domain-containing protein [Rhodocyclaceae bacterium]